MSVFNIDGAAGKIHIKFNFITGSGLFFDRERGNFEVFLIVLEIFSQAGFELGFDPFLKTITNVHLLRIEDYVHTIIITTPAIFLL